MPSTKLQALARYLECKRDELDESTYDDSLFECGRMEYLVLTDDEANERAREYIEESLWAFNASFLVFYLPDGVGTEVVEALQPQCEGANEAIRSMIGERFSELVEDAISADGRGHFMNTYDGNEDEQDDYYIYRTN